MRFRILLQNIVWQKQRSKSE